MDKEKLKNFEDQIFSKRYSLSFLYLLQGGSYLDLPGCMVQQ